MRKILIIFSFITVGLSAQETTTIYFDFAKDIPNEVSTKFLKDWIASNKNAEIFKIEGFCDSIDSNLSNKKLAENRIQNILKTLKSNGISISKNLEKFEFGEDFDRDISQELNRKVVFYYSFNNSSLSSTVSKSKIGDNLPLLELNFYNFSDKVLPKSEPVLYELLQIMLDNPTLEIQIQGHICCIQENQYTTSTDRAKTVYRYLIKYGIAPERLNYKGFGSTQPIYPLPEKNEAQREANRRVEILIVKK